MSELQTIDTKEHLCSPDCAGCKEYLDFLNYYSDEIDAGRAELSAERDALNKRTVRLAQIKRKLARRQKILEAGQKSLKSDYAYLDATKQTDKYIKYGLSGVIFLLLFGAPIYRGVAGLVFPRSTVVHANLESRIYHWQGCPNFDGISRGNLIVMDSPAIAESRNFRAAENCLTEPPR